PFNLFISIFRSQPQLKYLDIVGVFDAITAEELLELHKMGMSRKDTKIEIRLKDDWRVLQAVAESVMGISDPLHFSRTFPLTTLTTYNRGEGVELYISDKMGHEMRLGYKDGEEITVIEKYNRDGILDVFRFSDDDYGGGMLDEMRRIL
ncbi:hypothetical protein PFISCL1PPCAC_6438, partial [Pristionchus fissidentatus]